MVYFFEITDKSKFAWQTLPTLDIFFLFQKFTFKKKSVANKYSEPTVVQPKISVVQVYVKAS